MRPDKPIMVVNTSSSRRWLQRGYIVHIDGVSQQNIPEYDGYYDQSSLPSPPGAKITTSGAELVRQMLKDNF